MLVWRQKQNISVIRVQRLFIYIYLLIILAAVFHFIISKHAKWVHPNKYPNILKQKKSETKEKEIRIALLCCWFASFAWIRFWLEFLWKLHLEILHKFANKFSKIFRLPFGKCTRDRLKYRRNKTLLLRSGLQQRIHLSIFLQIAIESLLRKHKM